MIIKLTPTPTTNTCGPCTLCCKVLAVKELDKPTNTWCKHASRGSGCGVYDTRPPSCREFNCVWLSNNLAPHLRPDKIHGVITMTIDGKNLVVFEDPGYPGIASSALNSIINSLIANGTSYAIIATGDKRRLLGRPEVIERLGIVEVEPGQFQVKSGSLVSPVDAPIESGQPVDNGIIGSSTDENP